VRCQDALLQQAGAAEGPRASDAQEGADVARGEAFQGEDAEVAAHRTHGGVYHALARHHAHLQACQLEQKGAEGREVLAFR
jgi:hypothetical protein